MNSGALLMEPSHDTGTQKKAARWFPANATRAFPSVRTPLGSDF